MKYKSVVKFLLILFISFFTFNSRVNAGVCDKENVNKLKKLANQVEVTYEYMDYSNSGEEEFVVNQYAVLVNLLSNELYLNDGYNDYFYEDFENGLVKFYVNSGNVRLFIYSTRCTGIKLRTINLTLPKFNSYSYRNECKLLEEYDLNVCDPWYQGIIDEVSFYNIVDKYLNQNIDNSDNNVFDKMLNFFRNYYMYILGAILLIILIVIMLIVRRKRSVLE